MVVEDIRRQFKLLREHGEPLSNDTYELVGASFLADENTIFGEPNDAYIQKEIDWYNSQSRSIYDMGEKIPQIWRTIASNEGLINSNYGHLTLSEDNYSQYERVLATLKGDRMSRQGVMIYTRPTMHDDAFSDGMRDFVCTNTVQYLVRGEKLFSVVNMRSNDVVFGYRNDIAWQRYIQGRLATDLDVEPGDIVWQVGSLHVYRRHWDLII